MSSSETILHADELGRLLFQRRQNPMAAFWIVLSLLFGGIGAVAFASGASSHNAGGVCVGTGFVGVAGLISLCVLIRSRKTLRCHESGVIVAGWLGRRTLRFDQVAVLAFEATRTRAEGIPIGTTFRIRLEPDAGADARSIQFSGSLRKHDTEIETLREMASQAIAQRMARQLIAAGRVGWTQHLSLAAEGIEHRPKGFLGRKPPVLLPWEEITNLDIRDGWFAVWQRGHKLAVIRANVAQPNFFPGHRLLLTLLEEKRKLVTAST